VFFPNTTITRHMPHTESRRLNLTSETGQTLAEYSLLISLVAIVVAVVIPGVTAGIIGFFNDVAAAFGS
jgi:Flp pilus assembly pilin Flp